MNMLELLYFLVPFIIASTIPLAIVALGALFSERSGVINIALEGIMLMGAFVGAAAIQKLEIADEARLADLYESEFVLFAEDYFNNDAVFTDTFTTTGGFTLPSDVELNEDAEYSENWGIALMNERVPGAIKVRIVYVHPDSPLRSIDALSREYFAADFEEMTFFDGATETVLTDSAKTPGLITAFEANDEIRGGAMLDLVVNAVFREDVTDDMGTPSDTSDDVVYENQVEPEGKYSKPELLAKAMMFDEFIAAAEAEFDKEITTKEASDLEVLRTFRAISDAIYNHRSQQIAFIGLFVGLVVGMVFSLLHAFAAINMKSNQVISATALNMIAPAFAIFIARTAYGSQKVALTGNYKINSIPLLGKIPFIGDLFFQSAYLSTFIGIAIFAIAIVVLYKTKYGLRLRSCGENPQAADSLGINIYKIRYSGVLISGALAGMGGVVFVLSFALEFNATVIGFGFLSLAVLIFGNWQPKRIIFAALFFGTMRVISSSYSIIPVLKNLGGENAGGFYNMLPYLATLVVLAFVSKNSQAPRAAGEPYDPGKR